MEYGYRKETKLPFSEAVERIKDELKNEGFGILTEADIQKAMKEKAGIDMEPYLILGACNPPYANRALEAEYEVGLLLPCNVIVYEREGATHISAILPTAAMSIVENDKLKEVASAIEEKLKNAVDAVGEV